MLLYFKHPSTKNDNEGGKINHLLKIDLKEELCFLFIRGVFQGWKGVPSCVGHVGVCVLQPACVCECVCLAPPPGSPMHLWMSVTACQLQHGRGGLLLVV